MNMLNTRSSAVSSAPLLSPSQPKLEEVWLRLKHLEATYPGFRSWFWSKVAPGVGAGERRVFTHTGRDGVDGAVIAKSDDRERKLCTIWVAPAARGRGVASDLVDEALDWLKDPHPLLTVPDERLAELTPLVRARGFRLTQRIRSCYREGRVEHIFNGSLIPCLNA